MQQLAYFDEPFDPRNCHQNCDVCRKGLSFAEHDVTDQARKMVQAVLVGSLATCSPFFPPQVLGALTR